MADAFHYSHDIPINTDQNGMGLVQIPSENERNMSIFSNFQKRTPCKSEQY